MALADYLERFQNLKMNKVGRKKSPHKVCMLLAVMDLIQVGHIASNKIKLNKILKEQFSKHFSNLAQPGDKDTPENPFFHLCSEGFWHIACHDGYDPKSLSRYSVKAVDYAYLDDELFTYLKSTIVNNELKEVLVSNIADLAGLYQRWLLDIGKSEKTAENYLQAVAGSISSWLLEANVIDIPLTDVTSYHQFIGYEQKALGLSEFQVRDEKSRGEYRAALVHYRQFLADISKIDVNTDIKQIMENRALSETERSILVNTRLGQGAFRNNLINIWQGCSVTQYRNTQLLVASHIKPWRDSTNAERVDKYNGLLLLANLDKAFDLGFISFDEQGKVLISDYLEAPEVVGVREDMRCCLFPENHRYLDYHRNQLFKTF